MIEFFIDTSSSNAIIALLKDKLVINQKIIANKNDLSNTLFIEIENLFKEANIIPNQVTKIYAGFGPGSFTGIRIGLTIAKTYAYSLGIKVVPISSLEIMASGFEEKVMCLIDARRGYVFAGGYNKLDNYFVDQYIELEKLKDYKFVSYDQFEIDTCKPIIDIEKIILKHNEDGIVSHLVKPNYLKITEAEANYEKNNH